MIEHWKKGNLTIIFATEGGTITNKLGTVRGYTKEELTFNGWKRVDKDGEEWEDVDMSEPILVEEDDIEEIE